MAEFEIGRPKILANSFAKEVELSIQKSASTIQQNIVDLTEKWNTLNYQIDSSGVELTDKLVWQQEADKIMEQIRTQTICFYEITKGKFI